MRSTVTVWVSFIALVLFSIVVGSAQATGYEWNTDNSGDWYDASKWNPAGVPGGYDVSVQINRDPSLNVSVSLGFNAGVNSAVVWEGNSLNITLPRGELYFGKTEITGQPLLMNDGTIGIYDFGILRASGDLSTATGYTLTIRGAGSIIMSSGAGLGSVNRGEIILEIDPTFRTYNTVLGGGSQVSPARVSGWSEDLPLVNQAEINADGGYLKVIHVENEPHEWNGQYYGGILGTSNQGILILSNSVHGGFILPRDGTVRLQSTELRDTTIGAGVVNVTFNSTFWNSHTLLPDAQVNILAGTRLDLYNSTITNDGVIRVESGGTLKNAQSQAILQGSGRLLLVGPGAALKADEVSNSISNGDDHSIEGGGTVTAWIDNTGTVLANDHDLVFSGGLYGTGTVRIEGQDAANLAILDYQSNSALTTGSLHINAYGKLLLPNNYNVKLLQNFSFALRDESLWSLSDKVLNMQGSGALQALEVGGEDLGLVAAGFTDNFSVGTLRILAGAIVYLTDDVDNGNRHSPEAIYVDDLILEAGATLNLNGIRLYTYLSPQGPRELFMIDETNYTDFDQYFPGSLTTWPVSVPEAPAVGVALLQNWPNPFNPATRIEFYLPETQSVALDIYSAAGRHVARLANSVFPPGWHGIDWNGATSDGARVASGVYFSVLAWDSERTVRKMVLVR